MILQLKTECGGVIKGKPTFKRGMITKLKFGENLVQRGNKKF